MNFFERQEQARRKTVRLVFLYLLAVVLTVLAIHSLVASLIMLIDSGGSASADSVRYSRLTEDTLLPNAPLYWQYWFKPLLLLADSLLVILVIGSGTLIKINELSSEGGDGVAASLGGTRILPSTKNLQEKRLLNIVEEMAIASGIHVPNVYVLKDEKSINAFAAGFSPSTSVVAVTQGALDYLTRDELQGVVGHEFSHILNQDTNLNLRLIGVLFGLEMLVILGMVIFRFCPRVMIVGGDRESKGGALALALALLLFGVGLMLIGLIGQLFSNIIRSAISRQREFLADASSVQFTRNPDGLAGALMKIGSASVGSQVESSRSVEASHMFFSNVFAPGFFSRLFDSHPDLTERIRRIDKTFNGEFPKDVKPINVPPSAPVKDPFLRPNQAGRFPNVIPGMGAASGHPFGVGAGGAAGAAGTAQAVIPNVLAAALLDDAGKASAQKLSIAEALLEKIPDKVSEIVREPNGAVAAVYAILLGPGEMPALSAQDASKAARQQEESLFSKCETPEMRAKTAEIQRELAECSDSVKIPVAELAFPALKLMPKERYLTFRKTVTDLIQADGKIDILEFALYGLLIRDLDRQFGFAKPAKPKYDKMQQLLEPFYMVMSFFAWAGNDDPDEVKKAYDEGCRFFYLEHDLVPKAACTPAAFSAALTTLTEATYVLRHKIMSALYCCIAADGVVTEREGELIRAVAAHFDCPMPVWQR